MKKHLFTLLFLCLAFHITKAQITFTADDFPSIGDTQVSIDAIINPGITVGNPGANQTYDFSGLMPDSTSTTSTFIDPASTPGAGAFPTATLASDFGEGFFYALVTANEAVTLGTYIDTSENSTGQYVALYFDPTQKIAEFPSTFNTAYTDTWGSGLTLPDESGFADSIRITTSTVEDVLFDGYGTVITPEGSFNGLRSRTYSTVTSATEALINGIWISLNNVETSDTSYTWFAKESKGPLVSVSISLGEIVGVSYTVVNATALPPTAAFTFTDQGAGVVDFTDASTNDPTSWSWDFDDGNTSMMQNPQHTFAASGNYNVCLTATNDAGSNTTCSAVIISLTAAPVAVFSFTDQGAGVVDFTDESTNTPTSWSWDFDDGNTSMMQNPQHTFAAPGNYNVCLTATNDAGSNTSCSSISIVFVPVAAFNFTDQGAGTVAFTDASTNTPTSWSWDFDDGNTSTDQNPQHTFATSGVYNVCLTATNSAGDGTICQDVNIELTSINTVEHLVKLTLAPNPVKDLLQVQLVSDAFSRMHFRLINPDGQVVLERQVQTNQDHTFDLGRLPQGNYYYVLTNDLGQIGGSGSIQKIQ